jgi:signal transduction histidine kinase
MNERMAERERIARELHDTLIQGVQGLILRFQLITEDLPRDQPQRGSLEARWTMPTRCWARRVTGCWTCASP